MSRSYIIRICPIALLVALLSLAGCRQQKASDDKGDYTAYELAMTEKDTTEVTHLIDLFFEYLEHDKTSEAVMMLFQDDPDNHYGELQELNNDQIQQLMQLFKSFPIVAHRIEYIKFSETYENEVKVAAIFSEADGDMPEMKTYFYFRPVDYLGSWKLTLMNSSDGDRRLIDNEKADSMARRYEQELQDKEINKVQQQKD